MAHYLHVGRFSRWRTLRCECAQPTNVGGASSTPPSGRRYACGGKEDVECVAVDEASGDIYDLRELMLLKPDTFWNVGETTSEWIELNVCRSLEVSPGRSAESKCGATTAVCLTTDGGEPLSLGSPASPIVEDGKLVVRHVPCSVSSGLFSFCLISMPVLGAVLAGSVPLPVRVLLLPCDCSVSNAACVRLGSLPSGKALPF
jgi:hypothetical protein